MPPELLGDVRRVGLDQRHRSLRCKTRRGIVLRELAVLARHCVCVESAHMGHVEEGHFLIQHLITYYFTEAHADGRDETLGWSQLLPREQLDMVLWIESNRMGYLLDVLDQLTPKIQELTGALEEEVEKRPATRRLMTHPGVGPLTALAFELVIGTPERFHCGKQIASYVGLVPSEESSGDRRRLGHISKQGNSLLRFLLVEAAQVTVRSQPQWRSKFFHIAMRRGRKIAKVALARKLAVHLYWMWRRGWDYGQFEKLGSHAGAPGNRHGVQ